MKEFDVVGFIGFFLGALPMWIVFSVSLLVGLISFGLVWSKLVRELFLKSGIIFVIFLIMTLFSYGVFKFFMKFT